MPPGGREPGCCLCAVFLPLHELGYSEELVTLNFRGLGTRYCPVLLWFAFAAVRRFGAALQCFAVSIDRYGPEPSLLAAFADS